MDCSLILKTRLINFQAVVTLAVPLIQRLSIKNGAKNMPLHRILGILGSVLLLVTSGFHLTGLPMAKNAAAEVGSAFFAASLVPLWLMPTIHWSAMAILSSVAAWHSSRLGQFILIGVALVLLVDTVTMFSSIGPFLGEAMLVGSSGLFIASAMHSFRRQQQTVDREFNSIVN